MKASIHTFAEYNKGFERHIEKASNQLEVIKVQIEKLTQEKVSEANFRIETLDLRDLVFRVHGIMDYFSNEFQRVENFLEKYLPLKVQNQISHTLTAITPNKDRWRLRDYDEVRFLEMREKMLDDKGLPDLEQECENIITSAKQQSTRFDDFDKEKADVKGL